MCCKTIRCQCIESEQRRDELRDGPDGYHRVKDALPMFNQKSHKVSLLDRGKCRCLRYSVLLIMTIFLRSHPRQMTIQQLQMRLQQAESEVKWLHTVNEALMLMSCCHCRCCCPTALAILLLSHVKLRSRSVSWRTSKHRVSSA